MKLDAPPPTAVASARSLLAFLNSRPCPACRAGEALTAGRPGARAGHDRRRWRSDLVALLEGRLDGSRPAPGLLRRVNRHLRRAARVPQIAWRAGRLVMNDDPLGSGRSPDDGLGPIASWILLVVDPQVPIARCAAEGCRHYLLRRRSNQRWCSPEGCGNRVRVARHYRKLRRSSASTRPPTQRRPLRRGRTVAPPPTDPPARPRGVRDDDGPNRRRRNARVEPMPAHPVRPR